MQLSCGGYLARQVTVSCWINEYYQYQARNCLSLLSSLHSWSKSCYSACFGQLYCSMSFQYGILIRKLIQLSYKDTFWSHIAVCTLANDSWLSNIGEGSLCVCTGIRAYEIYLCTGMIVMAVLPTSKYQFQ